MPYQSRISSWRNDTARPSSVRADIRTLGSVAASAPFNLEVLHRDHGAVKELLLPVCGADAQPVASSTILQRRGCPIVFRAPAYDDRHPFRIGPVPIRRCEANRRSRIRCDSALTSARVRASTTLDLSGFARW